MCVYMYLHLYPYSLHNIRFLISLSLYYQYLYVYIYTEGSYIQSVPVCKIEEGGRKWITELIKGFVVSRVI